MIDLVCIRSFCCTMILVSFKDCIYLTNKKNSNLGGNRFGFTADGKPGYKKAGADTVYPFKGEIIVRNNGTDKTLSELIVGNHYLIVLLWYQVLGPGWYYPICNFPGCETTLILSNSYNISGQGGNNPMIRIYEIIPDIETVSFTFSAPPEGGTYALLQVLILEN